MCGAIACPCSVLYLISSSLSKGKQKFSCRPQLKKFSVTLGRGTFKNFYFVCVFCLHVPHLCQVPQEEKKNESDPLELELQMATMWVWEHDSGPSEKQHVLLIAESSL